ncbi:hypothetical protein L873DRAFT_1710812 [Choiromyces venosus 120613-1]|uniref:Uncharacterized protein n=1 Tax=Choiromyces venosus 120613-1 TaxID=1336337 RepID=A0A3N4JEQ7_9PEZI|nr:hypothetical protein L873DRAFT_1710812 [Choiromyces venosus 120613-1]
MNAAIFNNLYKSLGGKYILIGGASLACLGSTRVTDDIDLLLPAASIPRLVSSLTLSQDVTYRIGVIYTRGGMSEFPVDVLEKVIGDKTFEDLEPFTIIIQDGVKTLDFPIALRIKIRCFYLRNDETSSGTYKQDVKYSGKMKQAGQVVDDNVAKVIPICCYNMLLVKDCLVGAGKLALFLSVDGPRFQVPWEEDTDTQREYFMLKTSDGEESACALEVGEEVGDRSIEGAYIKKH